MAELVDALASGASEGNLVGVQVSFGLPKLNSWHLRDPLADQNRPQVGEKNTEGDGLHVEALTICWRRLFGAKDLPTLPFG